MMDVGLKLELSVGALDAERVNIRAYILELLTSCHGLPKISKTEEFDALTKCTCRLNIDE